MAHGELTTLIQVDHGDPSDGLGLLLDPAVKDLEEAVTAYLRRATETFDLSKNVEVCTIVSVHFVKLFLTRTRDAQRGNSLHCTAENSLPLPNF